MAPTLLRRIQPLPFTGCLACVVIGLTLPAAKADPYELQYTSSIGDFVMNLDGTLQSDGNTLTIDSISSLSFISSGVATQLTPPPISFLAGASGYYANPPTLGLATTSLDGSIQNFIACATPQCDTSQSVAIGDLLGSATPYFESTYSAAPILEAYSSAGFTLTRVVPPQAVPGPLPLFGAAAAFGWSRTLRRRIQGKS